MGSLPPTTTTDLILTDRGGIIENTHAIHAAIVSSTGALLHAVGNPHRLTLARSAAKPAQALAILETGAFDQYNFSAADLALICSSHSSEERHISRARDMLERVGGGSISESDLRCGGHPALSEAVNREWVKKDFVPGPLCNNCSGKHVGMLAGAVALGADTATYHLPDHPMQVRVRECVADMCGLPAEQVAWAVDGCNLPAPACPLRCLARNYALVAEAAGVVRREGPEEEEKASSRAKAMGRIFDAMVKHPEMVAGEGRFCTVLMEAFGDTVIGKLGADACYGVGVRASGQRGALGIAVKIEDGNEEILYAAVAEILEQLQIGTVDMRQKLAAFHHLSRVNTAGVVTGKVSFQFKVRAVSAG
ncbi:putative l-asparaginase ii protein [Lasiodiplodia theobromae]|nr:putative l-asparaginase ii protein [Lasiodiplodia theobromae]